MGDDFMQKGIRLFRIAGIDIHLDWSLLIIFFLVSASLGAGLFPAWHPEWSAAQSWLTGIAAAILFLASVLIHELSHAVVGRAHGMNIPRITLFIFGGMAHLEDEPRTWRVEFWMAIVGPVTSLLLGFLFLWAGSIAAGGLDRQAENPQEILAQLGPLATLLLWLGPVNIILAVFNLVPGFPLDGGRVMRAILWGATDDLRKATRWASSAGRAFAWFLIACGISMVFGAQLPIFGTGLVSGLWLALIGWFLHNAAVMSYRQLLIERSLKGVSVGDLMQRDVQTVSPGVTLREFVDDYVMGHEQRAWPVIGNGTLDGLVCLEDVRQRPREEWADTALREIMTPAAKLATVESGDDAMEAMKLISKRGVNQLPVVDDGRLRGLVRREDILRWLSLHGDLPVDERQLQRPA